MTALASRTSASKHAWRSRKRKQAHEDAFHESVAEYLDAVLPSDSWWTTFPAGGGGEARGAILKRRGLKAGVPDILIVRHGRAYWIELKAPRGVVSTDQTNTHADLVAVESPVAVCRTIEGIQAALQRWGFTLRARVAA